MPLRRRFVLNTRKPGAPAAVVCIVRLGKLLEDRGYPVVYNDWENYDRYDVVVFMAFDAEVAKAKARHPGILVVLSDPKSSNFADARLADFLLVSSVEQRDLFLRHNPNTFIYFMFPEIAPLSKTHVAKPGVVIGYHGNKVHLNALFPHVTSALEALGRKYPVEFRVIYNIGELGPWTMGVPDTRLVKTVHLQWSPEAYARDLAGCDIGIVPNTMESGKYDRIKRHISPLSRVFLTDPNDYLTRYKYSSNPGRIYVFAQLGIPVVADFFPSAAQFFGNEERGLLAHSGHGWHYALDSLAASSQLRQRLSDAMFRYCNAEASPASVFGRFLEYLETRAPTGAEKPLPPEIGMPRARLRAYGVQCLREFLRYYLRAKLAIFFKKKIFRR